MDVKPVAPIGLGSSEDRVPLELLVLVRLWGCGAVSLGRGGNDSHPSVFCTALGRWEGTPKACLHICSFLEKLLEQVKMKAKKKKKNPKNIKNKNKSSLGTKDLP